MSIETIRDNLTRTIEGKEAYLAEVIEARKVATMAADHALYAVQEFLKINLNELRAILKNVTELCEKEAEASWRDNPDRMGGQFTREELDNAEAWR